MLGNENATEPLVLGNELAQLMLDFMTECSKIMTPTLMGTTQPLNFPNFISLNSRIQKFLSKTSYYEMIIPLHLDIEKLDKDSLAIPFTPISILSTSMPRRKRARTISMASRKATIPVSA